MSTEGGGRYQTGKRFACQSYPPVSSIRCKVKARKKLVSNTGGIRYIVNAQGLRGAAVANRTGDSPLINRLSSLACSVPIVKSGRPLAAGSQWVEGAGS